MGNPDFDDIVTTTLRNRSGKLADNCTVTTALLDRMRRRGKIKTAAGGRTIVQELEVSLNQGGGFFSGYDTLNTVPHEPFTAAEYSWRQAYMPVVWSGEERRKNMGEHQVIDLVAGRIRNSEKSLYDLIAQAAYSAGTSYGGKQMHGLGLFVVASPGSNTIGGIQQASNAFWNNKTETVAMATASNMGGSSGTMPTPMETAMNSLAIKCTRGSDKPDLCITDGIGYQRYLESQQGRQRVTNTEMAGSGFTSLKYYGVGGDMDVVLDNGYCPEKTMFMLNTNYLYFRPHPDLNFEPMGGERVPVNQDAVVKFLGVMANFCASNLALQGRLSSTN